MTTKANNSVLDLVTPPIHNMVLLQGVMDSVVIGSTVPAPAHFTQMYDTELASPLIGAPSHRLAQVFLGNGLILTGNVLSVVFP